MNISDKLKLLRVKEKLTASEVAKSIGLTRSAYSNYEQGTRLPDYDTLVKIAKYFQVSSDYLLGLTEEP